MDGWINDTAESMKIVFEATSFSLSRVARGVKSTFFGRRETSVDLLRSEIKRKIVVDQREE